MKKPPVIPRAIERGLSSFRRTGASHLLPKARLGGPMPWVIAIMVALTVLCVAGALALGNMVAQTRGELSGGVTVQIIQADGRARAAQAGRAAAILRDADNVEAVRLVPQEEIEELVEPWLGSAAQSEAVPLPALIEVQLRAAANEAALEDLRAAIAQAAPDARVDAQADWLGAVFSAVATLRWLSLTLVALLAFAAGAAVWLAARNALNANRRTIEVVHLLGGDDAQIASIFQRSVLIDAAWGGLLGLGLGALAVLLVGTQFAALGSGFASGGGLDVADWVLIAGIPLLTAALALLTARMTVLAALRKLL